VRRWFLSYNSQDVTLVRRLEVALKRKDPGATIFFAPKSLRAGGYWLPVLAKEIGDATAFVLLVGEQGVGPWQVMEYYEALDRRVKQPNFPIVLVLLKGEPAPGLPFLRQLHWIVTEHPAGEDAVARIMDAASGEATRPAELWRYTAPYRGLAAMTEADSDFFFGRGRETVDVLRVLAATPVDFQSCWATRELGSRRWRKPVFLPRWLARTGPTRQKVWESGHLPFVTAGNGVSLG
jgi:TIR domain-containing protein